MPLKIKQWSWLALLRLPPIVGEPGGAAQPLPPPHAFVRPRTSPLFVCIDYYIIYYFVISISIVVLVIVVVVVLLLYQIYQLCYILCIPLSFIQIHWHTLCKRHVNDMSKHFDKVLFLMKLSALNESNFVQKHLTEGRYTAGASRTNNTKMQNVRIKTPHTAQICNRNTGIQFVEEFWQLTPQREKWAHMLQIPY